MKKLEKLSGGKFKAFKRDKVSNLTKLVGGTIYNTSVSVSGVEHADAIDDTSTNGWTWVGHGPVDFWINPGTAIQGTLLGTVTKGTTSLTVYNEA